MKLILFIAVFSFLISGCAETIPPEALKWNLTTIEDRQLQTRKFDTGKEETILSASAGLLQDLGYNIDDGEAELGLVVGSKDREAMDGGQIAASIVVEAFTGVKMATDKNQKIRVSIVTKPTDDGKHIVVRVTFQRIVWNNQGQVSKTERLNEPGYYQEFFEKLSKSVFLEAHSI